MPKSLKKLDCKAFFESNVGTLRLGTTDFKIVDEDTGEEWYWEHCGMMDDPKYKKRWEEKKAFYAKNGIVEDRNLIVTYDENGSIDSQKVNQIICNVFGA